MPRTFDEALAAAVKWRLNAAARDIELARMTHDDKFPVFLSLIEEYREDLMRSAADYNRSPEERQLDAGGLATTLKMLENIEGLMHPPAKEPEVKT
jgi:hypothetical protein